MEIFDLKEWSLILTHSLTIEISGIDTWYFKVKGALKDPVFIYIWWFEVVSITFGFI